MSTIQLFKEGDLAYTYFGGAVYKGAVFYDEKYPKGMRMDILFYVDNDRECEPLFFSPKELYVTQDELHLSAEEALEEGKKEKIRKIEEKIQKYCDAIVTMDDLIKFPLTHCINENCNDFDEEAKIAYFRRAQELTKNN